MLTILRIVLSRLVLSLVTLLVVSLIVFWAVEWLPGDAATRSLGRFASEERVEIVRRQMRLDDPPALRYWNWLRGFVRGDWGTSLVAGRAVTDYILPRLQNTLILAACSLALYVPLSLILGILTAVFRGSIVDTSLSVLTLAGMAVPEFVVGIILVVLFAVAFPIFPPVALMDRVDSFAELVHTLALPAATLTLAMVAYAVRMMRDSLIQVMESDYVRMAVLKGMPRRRVILRHALPNALGPAINVTALNIAWLIGGVVVVETVFNYPGIGRLLVDAIGYQDMPVIEAIAMILSGVFVLANLWADAVIVALNPRLRT